MNLTLFKSFDFFQLLGKDSKVEIIEQQNGNIETAVIYTAEKWVYIDNGIGFFLEEAINYNTDRNNFYNKHLNTFKKLKLPLNGDVANYIYSKDVIVQQEFFDSFEQNEIQSYEDFHNQRFWKTFDSLHLLPLIDGLKNNITVLDIGSADGRASSKLWTKNVNLFASDVSLNLIKAYKNKYELTINKQANLNLFLADGNNMPIVENSFDLIIVYGVFHHLPNPKQTINDLILFLKPGGTIFSCENNKTIFRSIFDLMMRFKKLWSEEAGNYPLISKNDILSWTKLSSSIEIKFTTHVFLPPHWFNKMSSSNATKWMLRFDKFFSLLPFLKNQGGLIKFTITKKG